MEESSSYPPKVGFFIRSLTRFGLHGASGRPNGRQALIVHNKRESGSVFPTAMENAVGKTWRKEHLIRKIAQASTGQHGVSGIPAAAVMVLQCELASVYVAVQVIANVVEKTVRTTQSHVQNAGDVNSCGGGSGSG